MNNYNNLSEILSKNKNYRLNSKSVFNHKQVEYGVGYSGEERFLFMLAPKGAQTLESFYGERKLTGDYQLIIAPYTTENAAILRTQIDWLNPHCLGLKTSAGMGDRLGLATPGHIRAVRKTNGTIAPILAQQSIRENLRTGRSPQQVMDDAIWGILEEKWQDGFGADADHLKTFQDIDVCLAAGFTFFTIDPGEHVNNLTEQASTQTLRKFMKDLPAEIKTAYSSLLNQTFAADQLCVTFDEPTLLKSMAKYGKAVWHVVQMYQYLKLKAGLRPFELEVSVDETDFPTSHAEHIYIAHELKRLGVEWVSLAPRFVGRFEKGVDYIGDLSIFETDVVGHASIARHFGPYKLSLHSGSDKFSIYPLAAKATQGLVHLKTAGTSYLEALRTIAEIDSKFFMDIYSFSKDHYENDKISYHVSAQVPLAPEVSKGYQVSKILDDFNAREILHVTFGSVLKEKNNEGKFVFYDYLMQILREHPEDYAQNLEKHFWRHLRPFILENS